MSLQSCSTTWFSKIPCLSVWVHTLHQSAAIWFYWFYNIISKDIPLLSDSIQSIDQLFHLNHTCLFYQTLHYYFRKYPTPLCKSIHSINQLQSDSIDYTLSFRKISPCWVIPYKLLISCFIYTIIVPDIRLYTTIFENTPPPCANLYISLISCNLIIFIIHYHFEKSTLVEWFHKIYWSDISFKSDLSLLSDSTLIFSKIPHPPVQIHTFHQSSAI